MKRTILSFFALAVLVVAEKPKKITDFEVPYAIQPGSPTGSYHLNDIESINLYGGKLAVAIPVLKIGGRGEAGYTVTVNASLPAWTGEVTLHTEPCAGGSEQSYYYRNAASALWWTGHRARYGPGMVVHKRSGWGEKIPYHLTGDPPPYYEYTTAQVVFLAPNGTEHTLYDTRLQTVSSYNDSTAPYPTDRKYFTAKDGSGITFQATGVLSDITSVDQFAGNAVNADVWGVLRFPNGVKYIVEGSTVRAIEDRNGNQITFEYESFPSDYSSTGTLTTYRVKKVTDSVGRIYSFLYSVDRRLDEEPVNSKVDVIQYQGEGGGAREIVIQRKSVLESLADGQIASTNLFPGLFDGGTDTIYYKVPAQVILANGTRYRVKYNSYGEVARVDLPTGGRYEYTHGPGLEEDASNGIFGGGRVNDVRVINANWSPLSCVPKPIGDVYGSQPVIYRRLQQRRVYTSQAALSLEKTTDYLTGETYHSKLEQQSVRDPSKKFILRVYTKYQGAIDVRETTTVSGSTQSRATRHAYLSTGLLAGCQNKEERSSGLNLGIGPFEKLGCDIEANPALSASPTPTDGKEWYSGVGTFTSTPSSFLPKQETWTVFGPVADGSYRECLTQDRDAIWGSPPIFASRRKAYFYDRTGTAFPNAGVTTNEIWQTAGAFDEPGVPRIKFSNLTDILEWDLGGGPSAIPADAPPGSAVPPACPVMESVAAPIRRTHHEIWSTQAGNEAYRHFDAHLLNLVASTTTFDVAQVIAAKHSTEYDHLALALDSGSTATQSILVSHPRGNASKNSVFLDASTAQTIETSFDRYGNVAKRKDSRGVEVSYSYVDNLSIGLPGGVTAKAFLSTLSLPAARSGAVAQTMAWKVDPYVGLPVEAIGRNGAVTKHNWADPLERLKSSDRTPGSSAHRKLSTYSYQDSMYPQRVDVETDQLSPADGKVKSYLCYDGLGREIQSLSQVSNGVFDVVEKQYDGFSRIVAVSNPYRVTGEGSGNLCGNLCEQPLSCHG